MKTRSISGILTILITITAAFFFTSRCYDPGDAVVTIQIERNDLAAMGITPEPELSLIDKILNFFSTTAEAGGWQPTTTYVSLTVTSSAVGEKTYTLPSGATSYSVIIPSGCDTVFTIKSRYDDISTSAVQVNWGGETKILLNPGEQEISIQMLPMAFIQYFSSTSFNMQVPTGSSNYTVNSYNIYRSTSIDGEYTLFTNTASNTVNDGAISGPTRYYYRISTISTLTSDGITRESIKGEPRTW